MLMAAILHFVTDREDPAEIIATFRDHMAPGSFLVLSHASHGERPDSSQQPSGAPASPRLPARPSSSPASARYQTRKLRRARRARRAAGPGPGPGPGGILCRPRRHAIEARPPWLLVGAVADGDIERLCRYPAGRPLQQ